MQEIMHKCPGAEQTLSLTGFDLHGMERAVGKLCHDIPRKCTYFRISIFTFFSIHTICNMFLKGYPLEAKYSPKN